jgi:hypothetical protein
MLVLSSTVLVSPVLLPLIRLAFCVGGNVGYYAGTDWKCFGGVHMVLAAFAGSLGCVYVLIILLCTSRAPRPVSPLARAVIAAAAVLLSLLLLLSVPRDVCPLAHQLLCVWELSPA